MRSGCFLCKPLIDQLSIIVSLKLQLLGPFGPDPKVGDGMPHAWIFDVLTDLQTYAEKNKLPAIAAAAADLLAVAKAELAMLQNPDPSAAQG